MQSQEEGTGKQGMIILFFCQSITCRLVLCTDMYIYHVLLFYIFFLLDSLLMTTVSNKPFDLINVFVVNMFAYCSSVL